MWAYVMGAQKNRLNETVLLSTHNICFGWEIRKIYFWYTLLTKGLHIAVYFTVIWSFFLFSRLYPGDKEIYVCIEDGTPQTTLELAFNFNFGLL